MSATTSSAVHAREGRRVRIGITGSGELPAGSPCSVSIFKGPRGGGGALIEKLASTVERRTQVVVWEAKGLGPDDGAMPIHYVVEVPGYDKPYQRDEGELVLWPRSIHVVAHDADAADGAAPLGAAFAVSLLGEVKEFHFEEGDGQGVDVGLWEYGTPEVTWLGPFELVEWVTRGPRKFEARVRRPVYKAVFLSAPEGNAPKPDDGCWKRKQYVNVSAPATPDHGSRIRLSVGADRAIPGGTEVWLRATFDGPGGKPSARREPQPCLVDADTEDQARDVSMLDADLPAPSAPARRLTVFTKRGVLQPAESGDGVAATFDLELGQAGGDVCTVAIGSTPECADAKLEITNWRRIGYHVFFPDSSLSDQKTFDGGAADDLPGSARDAVTKELAKAFIVYEKVSAGTFGQASEPGLAACVRDGSAIGRAASRRFLCVDEGTLAELARALAPSAQGPNEHTIVVVDFFAEGSAERGGAPVGCARGPVWSSGAMALATRGGEKPDELPATVLHQLSHAFGQAYASGAGAKAIAGVPFRSPVEAGGYVYEGHGHPGAHCAFGLSAGERGGDDFAADFTSSGAPQKLAPKCVNWGARAATARALCAGCVAALRVRSLEDLAALR